MQQSENKTEKTVFKITKLVVFIYLSKSILSIRCNNSNLTVLI